MEAEQPKDAKLNVILPVDVIRVAAMFLVVLLHVSIETVSLPPSLSYDAAWLMVNCYQSIARPAVPLFVMLTGFLLLQPYKVDEPIGVFLRKRLGRLLLPAAFWGAVYVVWGYFINNQAVTANSLVQDVLMGPYEGFWFVYLIIGLYLLTPILRVLITYASDRIVKYLLLLWFLGVAVVPLASFYGYTLNNNVFVLTGWIGYFVLGAYLPKIKVRAWIPALLLAVGFAWTFFASHLLELQKAPQQYFFFDSLSFNVIMMSIAMYMLLIKISPTAVEKRSTKLNTLVRWVSQNTLPIYLFNIIVLETFQKGLLGFTLNIMTITPIVMVPLLALIILLVTLGIILLLNKVPLLKRLVGSFPN